VAVTLSWGQTDPRLTRITRAAVAAVPPGQDAIAVIRVPVAAGFGRGRAWLHGTAASTGPEATLDFLLMEAKALATAGGRPVVMSRQKVTGVRFTAGRPNDPMTESAGVLLAVIEGHPELAGGEQAITAVQAPLPGPGVRGWVSGVALGDLGDLTELTAGDAVDFLLAEALILAREHDLQLTFGTRPGGPDDN
jgi:hypothetical protein